MTLRITLEEKIPNSADTYRSSAMLSMDQIDDFRFGEDMLRTTIMRLIYALSASVKAEVVRRTIELDEDEDGL